MMNKFLIGAAALAVAVPALAQVMPMADHSQTRAEVVAKVQQHFAMIDTNRDGFIAGDEMQAMGGKQHGNRMGDGGHGMAMHDGDEMAMHDGPMGNPGAMFDRLDANHDGSISRDEFARGHKMRIERKVVMNDGAGGNGGTGGDRQNMMHAHQMGSHMLKKADSNNDGRISLSEMTAVALQRFDRADTNHDGVITGDERQSMHQQMKQHLGRSPG